MLRLRGDPQRGRLPGVCACGQPYLVRYRATPALEARALLQKRDWTMWRYREWLPLAEGEGRLPWERAGRRSLEVRRLAAKHGFRDLRVKEEGANPTGSFKARGLAAAVTRAARAGLSAWSCPRQGNAGVALAAYAARAGLAARVYAPATTPPTILGQIRSFGGDLVLVDGHIGTAAQRPAPTPRRPVPWTCPPCASRTVSRQENPRARARGAARLDPARCDRVPHRWRHRTDRHVEGVRRAHPRRLAPRKAAPPLQRAGRGVRARRQRDSRPGRQAARLGPTHGPSPQGSGCPPHWAIV